MARSKKNEVRTVWLHEMTWPEVKRSRDGGKVVILIPVGSVEQHGYHLPLGTDSLLAIRIAEDAARRTEALVTPPLWFGWSPHHLALPGSLSVRAEVLMEVLFDIVSSLAAHGFDRFIVVNGHRIVNIPWIQISAERAQRELGVKVAIFDPAWMGKEIADQLGFGEIGHAEEIETSQMLHARPQLVQMKKAKDYVHSPQMNLYHVDPRISKDTLCYLPTTVKAMKRIARVSGGVSGQPSRADAEKGKRLHEHLLTRLMEVIHEFQGGLKAG
ncbi:MAG: creatininase family protein [Thermodesulfobacteriota bacterium]